MRETNGNVVAEGRGYINGKYAEDDKEEEDEDDEINDDDDGNDDEKYWLPIAPSGAPMAVSVAPVVAAAVVVAVTVSVAVTVALIGTAENLAYSRVADLDSVGGLEVNIELSSCYPIHIYQ